MAREYSVGFLPTTIAAASGDYDLFELTPADDKPVEIVGLELYVTSELQEAQEEWAALQIIRGHATSGNGTAATPRPIDPNNAAAGFAAETVGATIASTGTPITMWFGAMQVRVGFEKWWPERWGPQASQADTLIVVRMSTTFADDATMTGTLWVSEK